jgi:hypothetical protein
VQLLLGWENGPACDSLRGWSKTDTVSSPKE